LTGSARFVYDFYEHRPHGRLLAYDPATRSTRLVVDGLLFANGVAVSPDGAFLLVAETVGYRVRRVWLRGPRRGQTETFVDDLPGLPDDLAPTTRGTYWVGLARGPETRRVLDALLPHPRVRRAITLLPVPQPRERYAGVLELGPDGQVVRYLEDPEGRAYSNSTTATERDGVLYLGSTQAATIGRLPLPAARPSAGEEVWP
jgi:sugar lactone lactonase YvrE